MAAGHIAPGRVEQQSITELSARHVAGITQFHAFAGLGGWSHALRLAGWPDDLPVWTGSCPCQPFSAAGRKKGFADERHLWPAWFKLIRACRPACILGEQIASPDGLRWLDLVQADLEGAGYAVRAADLPAACVGAPHKRQRLYFVAVPYGFKGRSHIRQRRPRENLPEAAGCGEACELANTERRGRGEGRSSEQDGPEEEQPNRLGAAHELGDASCERSQGDAGTVPRAQALGPEERFGARRIADEFVPAGSTTGFWADAEWWLCRDGKGRPAQRSHFPLATGTAGRVGQLRAYGNAICAPLAATFIKAVMQTLELNP